MRLRTSGSIVSVLVTSLVALLGPGSALAADDGWEVARREDRLVVYNRMKPGSDLKEVRAVGKILAPPWVVKNVLDDVSNYKHFMPYTEESLLIKRGRDFMISYQRINAPIVANRDYTIRIQDESRRLPDGHIVYKRSWSPANHLGPAETDGVVRVKKNQGSWLLEEADGGKHTKATYWLYTDPGGSLPKFVINAANGQAIPGIFRALEKRSVLPRYRKTKPRLPSDAVVSPPAKLVSPAKP